MRKVHLSSLVNFSFGVLLLVATATPDNSTANQFPRLLALLITFLSVLQIVKNLVASGVEERHSESMVKWLNILPLVTVMVAYINFVESLGFYVSAWLAFVSIVIVYSPKEKRIHALFRVVPVALVFSIVLYLTFSLLLKVQLPSGILF